MCNVVGSWTSHVFSYLQTPSSTQRHQRPHVYLNSYSHDTCRNIQGPCFIVARLCPIQEIAITNGNYGDKSNGCLQKKMVKVRASSRPASWIPTQRITIPRIRGCFIVATMEMHTQHPQIWYITSWLATVCCGVESLYGVFQRLPYITCRTQIEWCQHARCFWCWYTT